jgi:amidohydrolase
MIAAGALEGVEAILGLHVEPACDLGKIGVRNGVFTATCDELEVRIEGRGGHASRPHESIDPIAAAAQLISSIYLFVPRAVDSHNPVVVTIGQIAGGDTANVIPNEVQLRGTIRTLGGAVQEQTKDHIRQLARGLAEASRTQITVAFHPGPAAVCNDWQLTALTRRAASQLLCPEQVEEIDRPSMGGEDFAHYLEWVPGAMFRLGCRSPTTGDAPLHSPMFDIDERAMGIGAKILARTAVLWSDPQRPKNAE